MEDSWINELLLKLNVIKKNKNRDKYFVTSAEMCIDPQSCSFLLYFFFFLLPVVWSSVLSC